MVNNNKRPNQHSLSTSQVLGGGFRPDVCSSVLTSARIGRMKDVRLREVMDRVRVLSSSCVLNGWGHDICVLPFQCRPG